MVNPDRILVGTAPDGAPTATKLVRDGLFPKSRQEGMIGQPVDVLVKPVAKPGFDDCDRLSMKRAARAQQHRSVGNFADQLMLEGVFRSDTLYPVKEVRL